MALAGIILRELEVPKGWLDDCGKWGMNVFDG